MSRYYPYGVWCGKYFMWCDDVVDITEGENECSGDCKNCEYADEIHCSFCSICYHYFG